MLLMAQHIGIPLQCRRPGTKSPMSPNMYLYNYHVYKQSPTSAPFRVKNPPPQVNTPTRLSKGCCFCYPWRDKGEMSGNLHGLRPSIPTISRPLGACRLIGRPNTPCQYTDTAGRLAARVTDPTTSGWAISNTDLPLSVSHSPISELLARYLWMRRKVWIMKPSQLLKKKIEGL